ncbi:hypothetical protein BH11MYX1_BH11MYX1_05260 [soil metagenome]
MRIMWTGLALLFGCGSGNGGNLDAAIHDTVVQGDTLSTDAAPPFCPQAQTVNPATTTELTVAGETAARGIFDPSIVYPAAAAVGVMAYSAVPDQLTIRTHIAGSTDHGASWTYAAEANAPEPVVRAADALEWPGGRCVGNLISEVSSLIYDADDPDASHRWKLFAHRYLVGAGVALHYRVGTITLQTAAQPQGPWTAPQKLIGWAGPSAYSSTGVVTNASMLPGMADCIALTEPGALWLPNALDLAVGCVYNDGAVKIRIELLRSPDHGASWGRVGTLVGPSDATPCFGAPANLNAPNLFLADGHEFVSATPSDAIGYHGCLVFAIDDIGAGHVARDATDRAIVQRALTASQFDGGCTFSEGGGGYLIDMGFVQDVRTFRIFAPGPATP